ncbi:MAG: TrbC/VirB2 family protein [Hyphomicrobiales bacterium]|nr:TrbC/VirB2 family protein [Hyphomicrobiales bacterium]
MNKHWFTLGILALLVTILPEMASATTVTPPTGNNALNAVVGGGLCNVISNLTGNVGAAIATLAVFILGVGAFFGKVNWGLAVMVAVGIAAIFGAASIVGTVDQSAGGCTT